MCLDREEFWMLLCLGKGGGGGGGQTTYLGQGSVCLGDRRRGKLYRLTKK